MDIDFEEREFQIIRISPHWLQYVIIQLPWLVLCAIGFLVAGDDTFLYKRLILYASWGLLLYLSYQALEMGRISYVITGEQLIYKHGVLFHSSDYMELYRIVDYQENRTPMQQLVGLKNVTILSGDKTLPKLKLVGIRSNLRILEDIRMRVEYNKKRRSIYEITNRL